jgi:prophage maintenance system killer protein
MQKVHIAGATRPVAFYSLDVIISVGYRVNSKRGTQFRIWATRTLKDHLVRGYTVNERRLREKGLGEMEQAVALLARTLETNALVNDQGRAVLDVVTRYARSFVLLRQYDEDQLAAPKVKHPARFALDLERANEAIASLKSDLLSRGEASELFGNQRGHGLASILGAIEQTFGAKPLYPSTEAKAAHLLYFVIKDHPFSDGNKRIGSFLFVLFLERNALRARRDNSPYFNDNALVALALLIAESRPAQKELMIRLVMNMLVDTTAK